jgi:hypothetical protein
MLTLLVLVSGAVGVRAQVQTGEVFGRATDSSGAVLPGVTVTLTSPALLQPVHDVPEYLRHVDAWLGR